MEGLNTKQAADLLQQHGYNQLPTAKPKNIFRIALEVIKEPMFLLLIGCSSLYILLGDYKEGIILLSTTFVIIFITFYQYQKTERALEALKKLSSPRALVIRDGHEIRIAGIEVVPGDVLVLNEGDRIAADGKVLDNLNLIVDESLLTGESVPVTKTMQADENNSEGLVFSGTLVVQGKGFAKVLHTGIHTKFGVIGSSLESIEQDTTRLQKEMKKLIRNLFIIGAVISVGVVLAFYLTRGNFIQSLLNGIASAMAILPEEFPVVLTVFMALGSWRLSKNNVLTRKPSAIETLGSATVLCTDKTGTLTLNKMVVAALYNQEEVFLRNQFSANKNKLVELISTAYWASQKDSIDPMEKAISTAYQEIIEKEISSFKLLKEYPLSKELFAMTRVLKDENTKEISVSCKGAPEAIMALCKMPEAEISKQMKAVEGLAGKGYRVLGLAHAKVSKETLPDKQKDFNFNFLGLISFEDPIRTEVPQAIQECKQAGIKVIMITGDYPITAKSIALQIGMDTSGEIVTGDELKEMNEEELGKKINGVNIFARVVPEQKLRIVQALKANNQIVAMTGDGVNDAPALKAADIGISMGNKGTDVAREASSLVLLDDNFASIVSAIRMGRRIFDNLRKAMSYIMAIHIPIIGLALIPAFFPLLPLLLMPLHIVFMELIIDPVCSIAFESEKEEIGIMKQAPRNPDEQFFGRDKILLSVLKGLFLFLSVIAVYWYTTKEGHTEGEIRAITFSSLIIGNIFLILTSLSKTRSFIAVLKEKNTALLTIMAVAMVLLISVTSIPTLQKLFSFEFPGYMHFIPSLVAAVMMLLVLEVIKALKGRTYKIKQT
jgi:P-type Ca2+ transporter type 2C